MAYFLPKKASKDAISILNRSLAQDRTLSFFERERIKKNLSSIRASGAIDEYHTASACFYAMTGDIESLLYSAESVFNSTLSTFADMEQVILALHNAMRYNEAYSYIKKIEVLDLLSSRHLTQIALNCFIIKNDIDNYSDLLRYIAKDGQYDLVNDYVNSKSLLDFYKTTDDPNIYSSYIISFFNWYSTHIFHKATDGLGYSIIGYSFYDDESIDFFDLSVVFKKGDVDTLLDLEDELTAYIASSDFDSIVKSRVNISMNIDCDEVKVYRRSYCD